MLKNLNTFKLLIILVVLVLIYLGFNYFGNKSRSTSFHDELVMIDTAKVDKLIIEKSAEELELKKEDNAWWVRLKNGDYKKATESSVKGTLETLLSIKPSRIVARNREKWKEYQVDTAGTSVKVFESGKNTLDLIIGRLNFKDQRSYYTYVRLANEEDTYVADNFMAFSINTNSDDFRDKQILRVKKDSIAAVHFNYPDSSFVFAKQGNNWAVDDILADSASTIKFFNGLNYLNATTFYDEAVPSDEPMFSVVFKRKSENDIVVNCWSVNNGDRVIQSSENPENYFRADNAFEKVFVGKPTFFVQND